MLSNENATHSQLASDDWSVETTPCNPDFVAAALLWASRGVPVFPCKPGQKVPATPHGFKDATTDAAVIEAWWREDCNFNIGLALGLGGFCAVDLDTDKDTGEAIGERHWRALQAEHGEAPATFGQATPSGGGHLIFAGVIPSTTGTLADYLDTRSAGGYIVAAPSIIDERDSKAAKHPRKRGTYATAPGAAWPPAPVPAWLKNRATRAGERKPSVQNGEPTCLENVRRALEHVNVATYAAWRDIMFACKSANVTDADEDAVYEAFDEWCATQPDYDAEQNCELWDQASAEKGIGVGTLFRAAREAGWKGWTGERTVETRFKGQIGALDVAPATAAPEPRSRLLSIADILAMKPRKDLVRGFLAEGGTAGLGGKFGTTKSFVTDVELCAAVATGRDFLGDARYPVLPRDDGRPRKVLLCAGEDPWGIVQKRIRAWGLKHGVDVSDPVAFPVMVSPIVPQASEPEQVKRLIEDCRALDFIPDLIVVDTYAKMITGAGSANDDQVAALAMRALETMKRALGDCTVLIVAHMRKDGQGGLMGSVALPGALDEVWEASIVGGHFKDPHGRSPAGRGDWLDIKLEQPEKNRLGPLRPDILIRAEGFWEHDSDPDDAILSLALRTRTADEAAASKEAGSGSVAKIIGEVRLALEAAEAAGTAEVEAPILARLYIEGDEKMRAQRGGAYARTPDQIMQEATRWKDYRLRPAIQRGELDDYLARHPDGAPKRGGRGSVVFRLPPRPDTSVGLPEAER